MKFATIRSFLTAAACVSACVALTGCVSRDMSDLENYASDILSRPGGRIDPLPPIKPYEQYLYQSGDKGLRNPFLSFFKREKDPGPPDDRRCDVLCQFVKTHNLEELEHSELDALRMVGILENNDEYWGIIRDPAGAVHRVQVGNYLGSNYGKILNIQENRIDLREIVKNDQGSWEERDASLALSEE
ncbi:MAG: pilus assembly protein PilP [Gammaproteobacteria bacterium]|nr:pilus assembly protein PilP [Gammaproteobacteria bacterium]